MTVTAFNAAEESLSPVILLADAFLSHLYEMADLEGIKVETVSRQKNLWAKARGFLPERLTINSGMLRPMILRSTGPGSRS